MDVQLLRSRPKQGGWTSERLWHSIWWHCYYTHLGLAMSHFNFLYFYRKFYVGNFLCVMLRGTLNCRMADRDSELSSEWQDMAIQCKHITGHFLRDRPLIEGQLCYAGAQRLIRLTVITHRKFDNCRFHEPSPKIGRNAELHFIPVMPQTTL